MAKAGLHPLVVSEQVAASAAAAERPASGVDGADVADELGHVVRERHRFPGIGLGGHGAGYPCLHRPWKRIVQPGFAKRDGLGRRKPGAADQRAGRGRFGLQRAACRVDVARSQREPGCELGRLRGRWR